MFRSVRCFHRSTLRSPYPQPRPNRLSPTDQRSYTAGRQWGAKPCRTTRCITAGRTDGRTRCRRPTRLCDWRALADCNRWTGHRCSSGSSAGGAERADGTGDVLRASDAEPVWKLLRCTDPFGCWILQAISRRCCSAQSDVLPASARNRLPSRSVRVLPARIASMTVGDSSARRATRVR